MRRSCLCRFVSLLAASVLVLAPVAGLSDQPRSSTSLNGADAQLKRVLEKVQQKQLDTALEEVERLIARYPNFRLAHLIRGDLLLARARPIAGFGSTGHAANGRLDELRAEALTRLRAYNDHPPADLIPRYLLQLGPTQKNAIVVDAGRSRVYIYENANGTPQLVEDYYTTLGKYGIEKVREGDKKTPIGVYHVTSKIPGSKLPDLYGWGAFPINQDYRSDNLTQQTRKRQYWIVEDGRWKIAYEAPTQGAKLILPESFPGRS